MRASLAALVARSAAALAKQDKSYRDSVQRAQQKFKKVSLQQRSAVSKDHQFLTRAVEELERDGYDVTDFKTWLLKEQHEARETKMQAMQRSVLGFMKSRAQMQEKLNRPT